MIHTNTYCISLAGLTLRFRLPGPVTLPADCLPFLCEDTDTPDAEFEFKLLDTPLHLADLPVAVCDNMRIYPYKNGWLRVFTPLIEPDGRQVALFSCLEGKNMLYYPSNRWDYYAEELHCLHLIAIEELLLRNNAFLLHSSVVEIDGQIVLFSAPSQTGKSTQASLWEKYLGAEIINGDRCIVRKLDNRFYGFGSPYAGTSGIYKNASAPIKGIILLKQAPENSIRRLGAEAFPRLFNQSIVNTWDSSFVAGLTDLIVNVMEQLPIYELSCRPDEEAVRLAYHTLFEGGR